MQKTISKSFSESLNKTSIASLLNESPNPDTIKIELVAELYELMQKEKN